MKDRLTPQDVKRGASGPTNTPRPHVLPKLRRPAVSGDVVETCRSLFARIVAFSEKDGNSAVLLRELEEIIDSIAELDRADLTEITQDEAVDLCRKSQEAHKKFRYRRSLNDPSLSELDRVFTSQYLNFTGKLLILKNSFTLQDEGLLQGDSSQAFQLAALNAVTLASEIKALPENDRAKIIELLERSLAVQFQAKTGTEDSGHPAATPTSATSDLELPAKAPSLWSKRKENAGEKAIGFLQRVYGPWLSSMHLSDLTERDEDLYWALQSWRRRHTVPKHLKPFFARQRRTRAQVDAELEKYSIKKPEDAYARFPRDKKTANRLYSAAKARVS